MLKRSRFTKGELEFHHDPDSDVRVIVVQKKTLSWAVTREEVKPRLVNEILKEGMLRSAKACSQHNLEELHP